MNEIENAIEYIETNYKNIGIDYSNGKDHTALTLVDKQAELAIEALKEKLEREKGCKMCSNFASKYCPYCGRKLGENNG